MHTCNEFVIGYKVNSFATDIMHSLLSSSIDHDAVETMYVCDTENVVQASEAIHHFIATALFRMAKI